MTLDLGNFTRSVYGFDAVVRRVPVAAWVCCRDPLLEALDQDRALQGSGRYWSGEMSVDDLIGIVHPMNEVPTPEGCER